MKKILLGILAVLYLITTSGVVVTIHYCMGKFSSAEYGATAVHYCDKCGMKEKANKPGCCHSENKIFKVADSHNYVTTTVDFLKIPAASPVSLFSTEQPLTGIEKVVALQYHTPPDKRSTSVYLYNSVFRI